MKLLLQLLPFLGPGVQLAGAEGFGDAACAAQTGTEFALTYGEPILAWEKAMRAGLLAAGPNKMITATTLASPSSTAAVRPNFDTLYMSLPYDVSRDDVELVIPKIPTDRFWSFSFYTAYGDNFLNFGALTSPPTGTYLLTLAEDGDDSETLGSSDDPRYKGIVYSPQTIGFLLVRIVVRNTDADIAAVRQIQKGITNRVVSRTTDSNAPTLSVSMFANTSNTQANHILKLTALYERAVPAADNGVPLLPATTLSNLSLGGISPSGQYNKPGCVNEASAYNAVDPVIANVYRGSVTNLNNGWSMPKSDWIGKYDTNYLARASIARWAYLALTPDIAIYPFYNDIFSLRSNESYVLRFSRKPPLGRLGFWSTTLYDTSGYLVANPIGRYAIGDRNNITFPDGSLVYGGGSEDGPFEILIQATQPPKNWTSNWLPSPATPGEFDLLLRFYVPQGSLLDGSYEYPTVTKGPLKK